MTRQSVQLFWEDIAEGDVVPRVTLDVTYRRVILNATASWELFPGHLDPTYARAIGHKTIFANTSLFLGFADRVITDWAGPRTFIAKRKLTMLRPVYPEDVLYGEGRVRGRRTAPGCALVDLELALRSQEGACATGTATIRLPRRENRDD